MIPEVEPSIIESEPHCFESGTRNDTPVHGGSGELDLEGLESEPLTLLEPSDVSLDVEGRHLQKTSKKYVSFATSVAKRQRL